MKKFIFGVFRDGILIFRIGLPIECTHAQAALIVGLLDFAKESLVPGDYFAYDYCD